MLPAAAGDARGLLKSRAFTDQYEGRPLEAP